MYRLTAILLFSALLAISAFAQVPYTGTLEDNSVGYTDPVLSP
jgi:hypothetical protein